MKYPPKTGAANKGVASIAIRNMTRTPWDTRLFEPITRRILGPRYTLSIVLIGDRRAQSLNEQYRSKHTPANVLAFPLSTSDGEIFINLARVRREAASFNLSVRGHAHFLLVHACLHLMGYDHGSTMEKAEKRYIACFNID